MAIMESRPGIIPVFTIVKIGEQKSDIEYWKSQSYQARLMALELIRREYHLWKYNAEPRLQRVYRIIKQ